VPKSTPKGCKDLKKQWWKATLASLKRLGLPEPDHDYGFSENLLKTSLSSVEYRKFCKWMNGQTMMIDDKLGGICYTHDVIRGIDLIRHGTPTYWD
jgi:hypothetical protein